MNSGLSFCLCLIVVSIVGSVVIARALRRLDEADAAIQERQRAWSALDLPSSQPPPCLRELDPNGPFDWQRLGEL